MAQQTKSNVALCPECEGPVHLRGKLHVGQRLTCRRCGSSLVIVDRRPLELDLANGNHWLSHNRQRWRLFTWAVGKSCFMD